MSFEDVKIDLAMNGFALIVCNEGTVVPETFDLFKNEKKKRSI